MAMLAQLLYHVWILYSAMAFVGTMCLGGAVVLDGFPIDLGVLIVITLWAVWLVIFIFVLVAFLWRRK